MTKTNDPASGAPRRRAKQKAKPPSPPFEELFRLPVVYSVPGMSSAQVREDVVFKTVALPEDRFDLKMDIYLPAGARPDRRYPGVVFVSGGGVDKPDWRRAGVYTTYGRLAAAHDFVGITYQKRFAFGTKSLAMGRDDTSDLFRFLRGHAAECGLDPERMALWAFSAGGLMLGPLLAVRPAGLKAILSFYPIMDAMPAMPESSRRAIREDGFSAVESLKKDAPLPALFVGRAGLDDPGLNSTIDAFVQEARRRKADIEMMNHPNGRHAFDILDPDARSREIIARAFEFLKTHLAGAP